MTEPTVPTFATMDAARRQLRIYGYSLKKVDGEYIARPYGAKDDECTIYASDLDSVVSSAGMDRKVLCWKCGNKLEHCGLSGHTYYCGACEISIPVDVANSVQCPTGAKVGDLKAFLANYEDHLPVRVFTDLGVFDIHNIAEGFYGVELRSEGK